MRTTEKILVFDTETAGDLKRPIVYDVGGVITDRNGEIYDEFHFVVEETFADLELMHSAYYSSKFKSYIKGIYKNEIELAPFAQILDRITTIIDYWKVKTVAAYNLAFDLRAMENTCNLFFENKNWLNRDVTFMCIMCAACDVLYGQKYIKQARANNWVTTNGNISTTAEYGYRFISGDNEFEEAHRGLDDCHIEAQILAAIYRKHKPFNGNIRSMPMRQVWAREKK